METQRDTPSPVGGVWDVEDVKGAVRFLGVLTTPPIHQRIPAAVIAIAVAVCT